MARKSNRAIEFSSDRMRAFENIEEGAWTPSMYEALEQQDELPRQLKRPEPTPGMAGFDPTAQYAAQVAVPPDMQCAENLERRRPVQGGNGLAAGLAALSNGAAFAIGDDDDDTDTYYPQSPQVDMSDLQSRIARLQQAAIQAGQGSKVTGTMVAKEEYLLVVKTVIEFMKQATGMLLEYETNNVCGYWHDGSKFTGFAHVYMQDPAGFGFGIMAEENKFEDAAVVTIPYNLELDEFKSKVEDLLFSLYQRYLEVDAQ